ASCAKTIEQGLKDFEGIDEDRVNFTSETIEGSGDVTPTRLGERVAALGYRLVDEPATASVPAPTPKGLTGFLSYLWQQPGLRLSLVLGLLALATVPLQLGASAGVASAVDLVRWGIIAVVG